MHTPEMRLVYWKQDQIKFIYRYFSYVRYMIYFLNTYEKYIEKQIYLNIVFIKIKYTFIFLYYIHD